jgi:hypothetical protein
MYHAYGLLNNHGLRSFKNFLETFLKKQFVTKVRRGEQRKWKAGGRGEVNGTGK